MGGVPTEPNIQKKNEIKREQDRLNKEIALDNKDKLKAALLGAIEEHKEISDSSSNIPPEIEKEQTEETPSYFENKNTNTPPKEIPEDVLRDILKDEQ